MQRLFYMQRARRFTEAEEHAPGIVVYCNGAPQLDAAWSSGCRDPNAWMRGGGRIRLPRSFSYLFRIPAFGRGVGYPSRAELFRRGKQPKQAGTGRELAGQAPRRRAVRSADALVSWQLASVAGTAPNLPF